MDGPSLTDLLRLARKDALEEVAQLHDESATRHAAVDDVFMATYERAWAETIRELAARNPRPQPEQEPAMEHFDTDPNTTDTTRTTPAEAGGIDSTRLQSFIDRLETNRTEMEPFKQTEKDLFAEAKSAGFSVKGLRDILRLRAKDPDKANEEEAHRDAYKRALNIG